MSDNQPTRPNWADKANLASNLLQNIQLHELHSTLRAAGALQAEQMRLAVSERQTTENEDRLREHIWQMENAFNPLVKNPELTTSAKYILANQIQVGLAQFKVTTASFRQFADKDRLGGFIRQLQQVMEEAEHQMSSRQRADLDSYLRYEMEAKELLELIEIESTRRSNEQTAQKRSTLKAEIDDFFRKKKANQVGYGITTSQQILYIGLPFVLALAVNVLGGLAEGSPDGIIILTIVFGSFFVVIFKWIREVLSPKTEMVSRMQAEIERLEKELAELDILERSLSSSQSRGLELSKKFGTNTMPELLQKKQERDTFMAQFRQANGLAAEESRRSDESVMSMRVSRRVQLSQPVGGWLCGSYNGERFFSNKAILVKGEPPAGDDVSDSAIPDVVFGENLELTSHKSVRAAGFSVDANGVESIWFTDGTRISGLYYDYFLGFSPDAQFSSSGRESPMMITDSSHHVIGVVMPLRITDPPQAVKEIIRSCKAQQEMAAATAEMKQRQEVEARNNQGKEP